MKKALLVSAIAAAFAMTAHAKDMEKCTVVGKDGKNLIKAHKSDCKSETNSCAGQNKAGDAKAWIFVPKGECEKINAGDFSAASKATKNKLNMPANDEKQAMETKPAKADEMMPSDDNKQTDTDME